MDLASIENFSFHQLKRHFDAGGIELAELCVQMRQGPKRRAHLVVVGPHGPVIRDLEIPEPAPVIGHVGRDAPRSQDAPFGAARFVGDRDLDRRVGSEGERDVSCAEHAR